MGAWSLYFFAKLALYYARAIGLHWWLNLAFAAFVAWPLATRRSRVLRTIVALPVGLALLYHDSFLPPWRRLLDQAGALSDFRGGYLLELAQRFVSWQWVLGLLALGVAYVLLAHRIRFATFAFIGLAVAAVVPPPAPPPPPPDASLYVRPGEPLATTEPLEPELSGAQLETALQDYYTGQHGKTVVFSRAGVPSFDIVVLSVCSLSDDDLDALHLREPPFLERFDIVFRQFNTAATYSGPAVLRLLHGSCGQTPQAELYSGTSANDCYLFRNLAAAGYRTAWLLNHDGHFDDFVQQLRMQGGLGTDPDDNRGAPVFMTAFDGTPVRDDYEVLAQWWHRHDRDEGHFAMLYNTISLHDGNRAPWVATANSLESYAPRLRRLFADLDRFIELVQASGRPTVLVLVPEHGAALRGDAVQVAGLRELPTRAITTVPAAVKLVGFGASVRGGGAQLVVERPASYLALVTLVAGLVHSGLAGTSHESVEALLAALPRIEWVAENEGTVLFHRGGRDYLRSPAGQWSPYGAVAPVVGAAP